MHTKATSDFLVASPSPITGAARLLDFYGLFDRYNSSLNEWEADYRALLSDWCVVGQELHSAMQTFESSVPPEQLSLFSEEDHGVVTHR